MDMPLAARETVLDDGKAECFVINRSIGRNVRLQRNQIEPPFPLRRRMRRNRGAFERAVTEATSIDWSLNSSTL